MRSSHSGGLYNTDQLTSFGLSTSTEIVNGHDPSS